MMTSPTIKTGFFNASEKKSKSKDKRSTSKEDDSSVVIHPPNLQQQQQPPPKPTKKAKHSFKSLRPKKPKKSESKGSSTSSKKNKKGLGKDTQSEVKPKRPVFGVPLKLACERDKSHDGILLPSSFRQCIDYVEEYCLSCEGIYRVPGVVSKVNAVINDINFNRPLNFADIDAAIATSVIKTFLRELPEPVLTDQLAPLFDDAVSLASGTIRAFQTLLAELPPENFTLLSWTMVHMSHVIARSRENRMNLENISIVLSPTLRISHRVLHVLFMNLHELFGDVRIQRYVPPLPAKDDMELPDTVPAIELELAKQNSLLASLHDELRDGDADPDKQNAIWEVQRVITLLKRKRNLLQLSDVDAIQNELKRQEEILKLLHDRSTASSELWEVTSTITLLKRKLKPSKKPSRAASHVAHNIVNHLPVDEDGVEVLNFTLRKVESESELSNDNHSSAPQPQMELFAHPPTVTNSPQQNISEVLLPVVEPVSTISVNEGNSLEMEIVAGTIDGNILSSCDLHEQEDDTEQSQPISHCQSETPIPHPDSKHQQQVKPLTGSVSPSHKSLASRASYLSMNGAGLEGGKVYVDGDLLQRVLMPPAGESDLLLSDDDEHRLELLRYHLMEDELLATRNDLNARITAEQKEIDRLQKTIETLNIRINLHHTDSFDNLSDECSGTSDSSQDDEDHTNLIKELKDLQAYNERLEKENSDLYDKIQQLRNNCVDLKIQLHTHLSLGAIQ